MENVLLDRSSGSFELPRRDVGGGCRPGFGSRPSRPRGAYGPFLTSPQYHHHPWSSTPAPSLPYSRPPIYSSPSLPLLPSNQPPLLPLPPTATKYATFTYLPPTPTPPPRAVRPVATTTATATAAAAVPSRQRDKRRRPARPPPAEPARAQKKKSLERATPLPPAQAVAEALDDLEQEVARTFVEDGLLHALAPPPSSLPLPRFSLVVKASPSATAAPSCNAEAATGDGLRRLLRL